MYVKCGLEVRVHMLQLPPIRTLSGSILGIRSASSSIGIILSRHENRRSCCDNNRLSVINDGCLLALSRGSLIAVASVSSNWPINSLKDS